VVAGVEEIPRPFSFKVLQWQPSRCRTTEHIEFFSKVATVDILAPYAT
jgi:hypothetical protein